MARASQERNMRIHLIATIVAIHTSYVLKISILEWIFIISAIALVLITEFINTCIEQLCDLITSDYSLAIKNIKDIAAASVVISAFYAFIIALFILLPKISFYL
jgi:diacylglycerol kinase